MKIALVGAQAGALCAAAVVTGIFAYATMFAQFQGYDDEGYLMVSVKKFLDGLPLYDQVFSQYGPFYYLVQKLLFAVIRTPVTHDTTRLVTIVCWIATAALCGVFIRRQTRSFAWALVAYLQVMLQCLPLINEPGHPQGLLVLLLMLLVVVGGTSMARTSRVVLMGALVGAMALTKVNLGVYAAVSLAIAWLALSGHERSTRAAFLAASAAAVVLPFLVMRDQLSGAAFNYAAIVSLSMLSCCCTAWRLRPTDTLKRRYLALGLASFGLTLAVVCAVTVLLGTSPASLLDSVLLRPLKFATVFSIAWPLPRIGPAAAAASLVLAVSLLRLRQSNILSERLMQAIDVGLKLGFGLVAAWVSVHSGNWIVWLAPFLWMLLLPSTAGPSDLERLFPRVVLCMLAGLQLLAAYPVAGSQRAWATLLLIPAAILCLADAIAAIGRYWTTSSQRIAEAALLVAAMYWYYPAFPVRSLLARYHSLTPLALPGARRIRLDAPTVAMYQQVTEVLRSECDTFISLPGLGSFYFWARKDPPTGLNATAWMTLFDDRTQQRVVDRLAAHPFACVLYSDLAARDWLAGHAVAERPLVAYIWSAFHTVRIVGPFDFMVRKDRKASSVQSTAKTS